MNKEFKEGTELKAPFELVEKVDLEKYAGTWYVISHVPLDTQSSLNESETYTIRSDGKIDVEYRYWDDVEHEEKVLKQTMWPLNNKNNMMRHQMSESETKDYGILEIDSEGHQWVVVGALDKKNCWIMCRNQTMESKIQEKLIGRLGLAGFQIVKMQPVLHKKFEKMHHQANAKKEVV